MPTHDMHPVLLPIGAKGHFRVYQDGMLLSKTGIEEREYTVEYYAHRLIRKHWSTLTRNMWEAVQPRLCARNKAVAVRLLFCP